MSKNSRRRSRGRGHRGMSRRGVQNNPVGDRAGNRESFECESRLARFRRWGAIWKSSWEDGCDWPVGRGSLSDVCAR